MVDEFSYAIFARVRNVPHPPEGSREDICCVCHEKVWTTRLTREITQAPAICEECERKLVDMPS